MIGGGGFHHHFFYLWGLEVAQHYLLVDSQTGKRSKGSQVVAGGFVDQSFDVGVGGQAQFVVTQAFTSGSKIDVFTNGVLMREGATFDFQRNTGANRIDFNRTLPQSYWVMVRVYV